MLKVLATMPLNFGLPRSKAVVINCSPMRSRTPRPRPGHLAPTDPIVFESGGVLYLTTPLHRGEGEKRRGCDGRERAMGAKEVYWLVEGRELRVAKRTVEGWDRDVREAGQGEGARKGGLGAGPGRAGSDHPLHRDTTNRVISLLGLLLITSHPSAFQINPQSHPHLFNSFKHQVQDCCIAMYPPLLMDRVEGAQGPGQSGSSHRRPPRPGSDQARYMRLRRSRKQPTSLLQNTSRSRCLVGQRATRRRISPGGR
ncbi:hypothetical protein BDK51DRAFT_37115 [Blyttiomyces helicus]|uniref:Uncharacterized protein n=1 Tax=Blyttiomyces helicus TaxID=388810 RepID=A0A4P9VUZ5_9FUNG|nr:hypothetical protein BDK51DRAFT_37115 [Blyttiomyces helicus]|eukprot:RKO83439.1 hypothetical protein BDK51DRAFT_37115 [Blyttiomyces helicus]